MRKRTAVRRWMTAMCCALVGGLLVAVSVGADWNAKQTTYLTFGGPVQIPGVTLGAGTYIFERVGPYVPNVIQVLSRDRSMVFAAMFTTQVDRRDRGSQLVFWETRPRTAPAIKAWYPEGGKRGHEFGYSGAQSSRLASLD